MNEGISFLEPMRIRLMDYRRLGERAMGQLDEQQINWKASVGDNSIYIIVRHLHGNMLSRFSDFLVSDGEKPWRDRDAEFSEEKGTMEQIRQLWNEGWSSVEKALDNLEDGDISKMVTIRGQEHTVFEAILRQVAHYAYHIGQIVYIAKMLKADNWETLSIPRGASEKFNKEMKDRFPPKSPI